MTYTYRHEFAREDQPIELANNERVVGAGLVDGRPASASDRASYWLIIETAADHSDQGASGR